MEPDSCWPGGRELDNEQLAMRHVRTIALMMGFRLAHHGHVIGDANIIFIERHKRTRG